MLDHVQLLMRMTKEEKGALVHGSTHDAGIRLYQLGGISPQQRGVTVCKGTEPATPQLLCGVIVLPPPSDRYFTATEDGDRVNIVLLPPSDRHFDYWHSLRALHVCQCFRPPMETPRWLERASTISTAP